MAFSEWFGFVKRKSCIDEDIINPATGLPMLGGYSGVDTMGNAYGMDHNDEFTDSTMSEDDLSNLTDSFESSFENSLYADSLEDYEGFVDSNSDSFSMDDHTDNWSGSDDYQGSGFDDWSDENNGCSNNDLFDDYSDDW